MALNPSGLEPPPPPKFDLQDLGVMIMELNQKFHVQNKAIMTTKFDQETMARNQEAITKQLQAMTASGGIHVDPQKKPSGNLNASLTLHTWKHPPSRTVPPEIMAPKSIPWLRIDSPPYRDSLDLVVSLSTRFWLIKTLTH